MPNLDQKTYYDMIQEAQTLRDHIDEWREQFTGATPESLTMADARFALMDLIACLVQASNHNREKHEQQLKEALARVTEGTSTQQDAILLRDALGMGPIK